MYLLQNDLFVLVNLNYRKIVNGKNVGNSKLTQTKYLNSNTSGLWDWAPSIENGLLGGLRGFQFLPWYERLKASHRKIVNACGVCPQEYKCDIAITLRCFTIRMSNAYLTFRPFYIRFNSKKQRV